MISNIYYLNEQGRRKNVEDWIFPLPNKATLNDKLFIVCDGVGGQSKGEEASRITCEAISGYINALASKEVQSHHINAAVDYAVTEMQRFVIQQPAAENMSTTMTLAYFNQKDITVAWCGDSRVYHLRDGKVLWQSKDHSLVQQLVDAGEITAEEAMHHPQRNIILRSLNAGGHNSKIDIHQIIDFQSGDYLLLCTDGILENIEQPELYEILRNSQPEKNKEKLFMNYCEGKTSDNFSMYLLQIGGNTVNPKNNSIIKKAIYGLILLIIVAFAFYFFQNFSEDKNMNKDLLQEEKAASDTVQKHDGELMLQIESHMKHDSSTINKKASDK